MSANIEQAIMDLQAAIGDLGEALAEDMKSAIEELTEDIEDIKSDLDNAIESLKVELHQEIDSLREFTGERDEGDILRGEA